MRQAKRVETKEAREIKRIGEAGRSCPDFGTREEREGKRVNNSMSKKTEG